MEPPHNILVNGDLTSAIPAQDRGFAYGDGVFRTLRVIAGLPHHWHLHYQKLSADCASIGIVCPSPEVLMEDITKLFLEDVENSSHSVAKIMITRGVGKRGYMPPAVMNPMRVVMKLPMPSYPMSYFVEGVSLRVCDLRLSKQPKLAGIKHLNRLENVMARMEWQDDQIFDGVLLDQDNAVIECTMSNIFCRKKNTLKTPSLEHTGVAGVTRDQVLTVGKLLELETLETEISLETLFNADEVLISNSLFGVLQVKRIDNKEWPAKGLAANFRSLIEYDPSH